MSILRHMLQALEVEHVFLLQLSNVNTSHLPPPRSLQRWIPNWKILVQPELPLPLPPHNLTSACTNRLLDSTKSCATPATTAWI